MLSNLNFLQSTILQYTFSNPSLLVQALTINADTKSDSLFKLNYERLEFLGDAMFEAYVIGNYYKENREKKL